MLCFKGDKLLLGQVTRKSLGIWNRLRKPYLDKHPEVEIEFLFDFSKKKWSLWNKEESNLKSDGVEQNGNGK